MGSSRYFHIRLVVFTAFFCENVAGHFLREHLTRSAAGGYLRKENATQPGAEAHLPDHKNSTSEAEHGYDSTSYGAAVKGAPRGTEFKSETGSTRTTATSSSSLGSEETAKYPVIRFFDRNLQKVFGNAAEHWYQDWKIWVGLICWLSVLLKWTIQGYDEIYWQRGLFCFGINIMILHHLQYAETTKMGMAGVCFVLSAQCLAQAYLWFRSELENDEEGDLKDFVCDTLYLDLSLPIIQIIVLFAAQCMVWWFYMTWIIANFDFDHVRYSFWLVAYMTMQMTMIFNRGEDSVLGNPFPVHEVHRLYVNCGHTEFSFTEDEPAFKLSKCNILLRGVMGFFTNAVLREIMSYTIPLLLMSFSEPMDFVVYCVGVNFICTLDDMSEKNFALKDPKSAR